MIKILSSVRSTYRAVSVVIDGENISNNMQRSLELVRTCNQDLQELIKLRNEHLDLLEKQPHSLERLNSIIEKVHNGLLDASRIVEKYRPQLQSGKKSLQTQMAWAHRDSQEFQALGPTMSQHNATILAEISFLRSLTIITTKSEPEKSKESTGFDEKTVFNNLELLKDLMGDLSGSQMLPTTSPPTLSLPPPPPPVIKVNERAIMPNLVDNSEYCDLPEPVFPNIIPHQQPITSSLLSEQTSSLRTQGGQALEDGNQRKSRVVLNQSDHSGLSLLFGDEPDINFDISSKIQPHHSRARASSSTLQSPMPSFSSSSVNGGSINTMPSTRYSLTSKPSNLSLNSTATFNQQSPELSTNRPHLFSLPPTPPTNNAPLISLSVARLSEAEQDILSRPRTIPFAERYANMAHDAVQENPRYRPWRPYKNSHVHELQGSDVSHEMPVTTQSTTSLTNRSDTQ